MQVWRRKHAGPGSAPRRPAGMVSLPQRHRVIRSEPRWNLVLLETLFSFVVRAEKMAESRKSPAFFSRLSVLTAAQLYRDSAVSAGSHGNTFIPEFIVSAWIWITMMRPPSWPQSCPSGPPCAFALHSILSFWLFWFFHTK